MAQAEYEKARDLISETLKQNDLSSNQRAQIYWQKAVCHISEGQLSQAKSSFLKLLASDPFFEVNKDVSPKIVALFDETYEMFKESGGLEQSIKAQFAPIEVVTSGEPFAFKLKIDDKTSLSKIGRIRFHLRKLGNSEYSSLDFAPKPNAPHEFEAIIPPVLTKRVETEAMYEYYVDFLSGNETRVGGIGKYGLPLNFLVNARSQVSHATVEKSSALNFFSAGIWMAAAAAAIGGIIAACLAISAPQESSLFIRVSPAG